MQKQSKMNYVLLPVPAEVMEELELDEYSTVQYSISKGRLIIEPIDAQQNMVCIGCCCRCKGRLSCEDAFE